MYSWKMRYFSDYAQQLEMESIGKQSIQMLYLRIRAKLSLVVLAQLHNIHIFNYCIKALKICADDIIEANKKIKQSLAYAQAITQSKLLVKRPHKDFKDA